MELKRQKVKLFSKSSCDVKNLYLSAFPAVERVPYFSMLLTSYRELADFYAYYDGDDFVGLAYVLQNEDVVYLFFLAVNPQIRSRGYGSEILQDIKKISGNRPVVLAIEPMDEKADNFDQRLKRVRFYEKNGFHITAYYYHEGTETYQMMANNKTIAIDSIEKLTKKAVLGLVKVSYDKK